MKSIGNTSTQSGSIFYCYVGLLEGMVFCLVDIIAIAPTTWDSGFMFTWRNLEEDFNIFAQFPSIFGGRKEDAKVDQEF